MPNTKTKKSAKPAPKAKAPAKPAPKAKTAVKAKAPAKPAPKSKVVAKAPAKPAAKGKAPAKPVTKASVKDEKLAKKGKAEDPKELKGKKAKALEAEVAPQEEKKRGRKAKEVPADGAEPVLTDRQKARERKAKEKALLKEFAAQQLGTEEQQELRRARLKTLIKMGMSKGYLTHGEMNDVMSDELSDADALNVDQPVKRHWYYCLRASARCRNIDLV